jgi:Holliday junction resolvase-like predicted endonuclease
VPQRVGVGHPLEAITLTKMQTLRQLAAIWMRQHHVKASTIRLDAIRGDLSSIASRAVRQLFVGTSPDE